MAHNKKALTPENKKNVLSVALGVVGLQFDNPNVVDLIIKVYDLILETQGAVTMPELIEIRDEFLKNNPPNEPSGPKATEEEKG